MKKLRICLEIAGLAIEENGNPCPVGLSMTLGEVSEDGFDEKYVRLLNEVKIEDILKLACLDGQFDPSNCRIITPEEYDEKYGDEDNE